ncbi:chemotaxis protein CheW [Comamonas sp. Y33R10-2]|uniref:chemotaxis protein CheW n=1 Tax=Comamonas sp. Y33R10-2 TaxID=2853257 RepID=UPI001C5C863A|nr:chemotaxis protein CheW [Comamonas sp. Y33R10-2]QXZ09053.1 chemotaxis protein CheW [Comamonas sp. Y33R10-2]
MADTHQDGAGSGADFDLSQFYQIFFEEASENLDQMEQMLLSLDLSAADDEELNGIFRCAHSIKGGAATFGFSDVTELTHRMESLLDRLRRHEITPVPAMVDVLLESADASRSLLARHQSGDTGEPISTAELVVRIEALAQGLTEMPQVHRTEAVSAPAQAAAAKATAPVQPAGQAAVIGTEPPAGARVLQIDIGPLSNLALGDSLKELFRDIPGLGTIQDQDSSKPDYRRFEVKTVSSDDELCDLFVFHVSKVQVTITEQTQQSSAMSAIVTDELLAEAVEQEAVTPSTHLSADDAYGFFVGAPGGPDSLSNQEHSVHDSSGLAAQKAAPKAAAALMESTSIRVDVKKVDQLINLVGELVITQAMLAQNSQGLDPAVCQQLLAGLADLDRNTRDLQESVMSIRMIPMSTVFSRFPRMLRDLAGKLNKKVDFVTLGEATELDKGLVEKITDPLTHLVRNSVDHGIELPADRLAAGKSENGTLTLAASHQGGSIVIEVRDDGRGMNRERILSKARERGMDVSDAMPDGEVWQLIFAPGFSTADVVTDVSGRGVGMDVVKRNITSLGGTVEIDSVAGQGMKVSVRLPLTLAIMDGMSVGVGDEVYILPLSSVVESFQVKGDEVNTVANGTQLVKVRDEYMPVIALERTFQIPRSDENETSNIMVVVEADGSRVALLVDELLGQHQVVVKNLESNYRKVPNVSGATILGDGSVALILDTGALVRRTRH